MKHLVIAIALCATSAHAEFQSGNDLHEGLNADRGSFAFNYAFGYTIGAFDAMVSRTICPPAGITQGQVLDMTTIYLRNNPTKRHHSADSIIAEMFAQMWPCRRGNGT